MCIDNGTHPDGEAIAILHQTPPSSSSFSSSSPSSQTSPYKLLISNSKCTSGTGTSYLCLASDSMPPSSLTIGTFELRIHRGGDLRACQNNDDQEEESQFLVPSLTLKNGISSNKWSELDRKLSLGVSEMGVIGRKVSLVRDGFEIASGIIGVGY